jgi:hypothetical protein
LQDNVLVRIDTFSDEQARLIINLAQQYQVWADAERSLLTLPYNLLRKEVKGHAYLYEVLDRANNARSLGPWSADAEARVEEYQATKKAAKERRALSGDALDTTCRLYRALRLPQIDSAAGGILREADRRGLLGTRLLVIGTNAMPAYSLEAAGFIRDVPDETFDFDMAWAAETMPEQEQPVWDMLKAVDPTFTVNTERPFQARSAKAYEFELLAAPSRLNSLPRRDRPLPVALPEQEWLLRGRPVDHVLVARDLRPARIVAPDPRWFALHKLWLAEKPERNPLKKTKDRKQGVALLSAIEQVMPHYPLDGSFADELPEDLRPYLDAWRQGGPT